MNRLKSCLTLLVIIAIISSCFVEVQANDATGSIIINHSNTRLDQIPAEWISAAKSSLHIAYWHTSHGSQVTDGMRGLANWKGSLYSLNDGGSNGALDFMDSNSTDLGNGNWPQITRNYLNSNPDTNVVMWSWCGQVGDSGSDNVVTDYLNLMSQLENEYPNVYFVYMTGHLDGTGENGRLNLRNNMIRQYCINNNKILFDFADIESYDPDGNYYLDKGANDGCDYDSDGNGSRDRNWARDWQNSHTVNVDWYNCSSAHSEPLNANMKAYAAWWMFARLAGWGSTGEAPPTPPPVVPVVPAAQSAFRRIEAESYSSMSGVQTESCTEGGLNVGFIENGDYLVYNNLDFGSGVGSFTARVASETNGGQIEIRLDSPSGTLAGTCNVGRTGGWQTWNTVSCDLSGVSGVHNLYIVSRGSSGYLYNINWFEFSESASDTTPPGTTAPGTSTPVTSTPGTTTSDSTAEMSAQFVSCTTPNTLITDQVFEAQIVMRNNGTAAWGQNSGQIKVTLVSQGPAFNTTWGTYFIIMGQGNTVEPGETFTFNALLRAPSTPGSFDFSWRCLNDIPAGGVPVDRSKPQFGETASKRITVTQRQETKPADPPHRNGILDASDLEYVGSFQTNNVQGQENIYTESGLTLRKVNGSKHLLLRTGTYNYRLYEIGIPTPVKITGNSTILTAPFIRDWGELSYGQINGETIGANAGMWFDNSSNTLYWSHYNAYYTGGAGGFPQLAATRLNSDGTKTNVGYWYLPDGLQKYKGYWGGVTKLSTSFANTYTGGRELALGFGGYYSICGSASRGPALAAVKLPSGSGTRLDMKEMMYYPDPIAAPRDGNYFSNIYWGTIPDNLWEGEWTGVDICRAGVFIDLPDKKGYMAFANQGIGRIGYDYGGYNADGHYQNCWYFYNINDLGAAASGTKSPTSIVPTSFTTVEYPSESGSTFISGACFDEETRMLYLYAKRSAGYNGRPVIHVYHVKEGNEGENQMPPVQDPGQPEQPGQPGQQPTQPTLPPMGQLPVQQPEQSPIQSATQPSANSNEDTASPATPPKTLFKELYSYEEAKFTDVREDWGKESIILCYAVGLMNGRGNQKFAPNEPATIAEVVTIAARIRDIFSGGEGVFPPGDTKWYDNSVKSAIKEGIISQDQFSNFVKNASRAEVAAILANALPGSEYAAINSILQLPDVDKATKYSTEIFKLYNAGIVSGNDRYGTFSPNRTITRKELAAIICRLVFPDKRLKFTLENKP